MANAMASGSATRPTVTPASRSRRKSRDPYPSRRHVMDVGSHAVTFMGTHAEYNERRLSASRVVCERRGIGKREPRSDWGHRDVVERVTETTELRHMVGVVGVIEMR